MSPTELPCLYFWFTSHNLLSLFTSVDWATPFIYLNYTAVDWETPFTFSTFCSPIELIMDYFYSWVLVNNIWIICLYYLKGKKEAFKKKRTFPPPLDKKKKKRTKKVKFHDRREPSRSSRKYINSFLIEINWVCYIFFSEILLGYLS